MSVGLRAAEKMPSVFLIIIVTAVPVHQATLVWIQITGVSQSKTALRTIHVIQQPSVRSNGMKSGAPARKGKLGILMEMVAAGQELLVPKDLVILTRIVPQ